MNLLNRRVKMLLLTFLLFSITHFTVTLFSTLCQLDTMFDIFKCLLTTSIQTALRSRQKCCHSCGRELASKEHRFRSQTEGMEARKDFMAQNDGKLCSYAPVLHWSVCVGPAIPQSASFCLFLHLRDGQGLGFFSFMYETWVVFWSHSSSLAQHQLLRLSE